MNEKRIGNQAMPPASKRDERKRFGRRDLALLLIIFIILIALFAGSKLLHKSRGSEVVVEVGGEEYGRYPLTEDADIPIDTKNGTGSNMLIIEEGKANMVDANCPDQLCVHQKAISRQGETIVCLPNQVVISIAGGETAQLDTIAQ